MIVMLCSFSFVIARNSSVLACAILMACVMARLSEWSRIFMWIDRMCSSVNSSGGFVAGSVSGSSNGCDGSVSR